METVCIYMYTHNAVFIVYKWEYHIQYSALMSGMPEKNMGKRHLDPQPQTSNYVQFQQLDVPWLYGFPSWLVGLLRTLYTGYVGIHIFTGRIIIFGCQP